MAVTRDVMGRSQQTRKPGPREDGRAGMIGFIWDTVALYSEIERLAALEYTRLRGAAAERARPVGRAGQECVALALRARDARERLVRRATSPN